MSNRRHQTKLLLRILLYIPVIITTLVYFLPYNLISFEVVSHLILNGSDYSPYVNIRSVIYKALKCNVESASQNVYFYFGSLFDKVNKSKHKIYYEILSRTDLHIPYEVIPLFEVVLAD